MFYNISYTLNKISNWLLFKLIISDQALKLLIYGTEFLPKYVLFNGEKLNGLSEKLSFNPKFFLLKMQNICFLDKNGFE